MVQVSRIRGAGQLQQSVKQQEDEEILRALDEKINHLIIFALKKVFKRK